MSWLMQDTSISWFRIRESIISAVFRVMVEYLLYKDLYMYILFDMIRSYLVYIEHDMKVA
jgi:hypothetical protein